MFKTEKMKKLFIVCTKKNQAKVVSKLHEMKVIHIIDHKKTEELDIGRPSQNSEKISSLLVKTRAYVSNFNIKSEPTKKDFQIKKIEAEIERFDKRYKELSLGLKSIDNKLSLKRHLLEKMELIQKLPVSVNSYRNYKSLAVFLGTIKCSAEELKLLKKGIESLTAKCQFYSAEKNNKNEMIAALFIETQKKESALDLLKKYNYAEISISDIIEAGVNDTPKLKYEIKELNKKKEVLNAEISAIINSNRQGLANFEYALEKELEKCDAPLRFAATKETVAIFGWVPERKTNKIKEELEEITKGNLYFEEREIEKGENVPIILKNPILIKPFEFFLNMYTLPSYKEIDPTFFMFFTFPLFFGIMLGDAGYGLIISILFLILRKKMPGAKTLLNAMIICALITICFGIAFGEYLGYESIPVESSFGIIGEKLGLEIAEAEGHEVYEIPRLLKRTGDNIGGVPLVLLLGAAIGILHLNFGLLLGFINEYKSHGFKTAFFEKMSWVVLQIGFALAILSLVNVISLPIFIGLAVFALALWMLYKGEGVRGLIEFPSILSNIMSYMRLGALGLASVYLALVINEYLAAPFFEKGGIYIAFAIIIMVVGHSVNIALGIIGPFLHSLRLHYVEFFSKFYKGGGIRFQAFGASKEE